MSKQVVITPSGDRMVILPETEFDAMIEAIEDQEDIAAAKEAQRRLEAGEAEMIPAEIANRIIDGENKVRVWRDYRGLSQRDLADKSGVSTAYLSQIESGRRDGTFETIKRIAAALSITVDDLA